MVALCKHFNAVRPELPGTLHLLRVVGWPPRFLPEAPARLAAVPRRRVGNRRQRLFKAGRDREEEPFVEVVPKAIRFRQVFDAAIQRDAIGRDRVAGERP
ncbi:MAG: hypothetical protein A2W31_07935 [Planctomycetes bacterium RBG_16_64_10]|nr:MAG: hypothetical protein A2W31_07935 [Planctomycetes bacterium RBG_16_64_10]